MYPAFEEIEEYLSREVQKPLILCEYSNSMGNGPGDLEDYFALFQKHESMCGGFVWEWCDHAVAHEKVSGGRTVYYYGGDHGEEIHDGNFCMDGLVYPDRRPHTGLMEFGNVYRPARVVSYDIAQGIARIHNYMDFTNLKDYCRISWEVSSDGVKMAEGTVESESLNIAPHGEGEIKLENLPAVEGRSYLKLKWILKEDKGVLLAGKELGFDEILLSEENSTCVLTEKLLKKPQEVLAAPAAEISVAEDDRYLTVESGRFCYVYNKLSGIFDQMVNDNRTLLELPM